MGQAKSVLEGLERSGILSSDPLVTLVCHLLLGQLSLRSDVVDVLLAGWG